MKPTNLKKQALLFLLLLGVISFLSDFTHEGARSIYGPYLGLIGASAAVIAFTSGLGEFIGQSLRIVTGYIADKTKKYWLMMILGYAINLLVIPLLAFVDASIWHVAIVLILVERVGKGIRAPAKSALTSFTTSHLGVGKAFALQEVMDQVGAFLGPVFVYLVLQFQKGSQLDGYQLAFGLLGIFAVLTLVILILSKQKYPHPETMESSFMKQSPIKSRLLMLYFIAIALIALGFIDYPVLAFHIANAATIDIIYIPLLYAMAMGVDAIAAFIFGHLFDRFGVVSLMISVFISLGIAPVFFLISSSLGLIFGLILWGIAMGAQESVLKAVVATLVSKEKRATAYGMFYTVFGLAWFIGSFIVGLLYEQNLVSVIIFVTLMQLLALLLLGIYHSLSRKSTIPA